jgi:hypothetical protein
VFIGISESDIPIRGPNIPVGRFFFGDAGGVEYPPTPPHFPSGAGKRRVWIGNLALGVEVAAAAVIALAAGEALLRALPLFT